MASKPYKDYRFSVKQVNLMSQLYNSGMTADDVIAGFKQIQDVGNPTPPKTPSPINKHNDSSFNSPQSYHNLTQDSSVDGVSFIFKTPSSSEHNGAPSMVFTPPVYTQPQPQPLGEITKRRGSGRSEADVRARGRGRPKRSKVDFNKGRMRTASTFLLTWSC